MRPDIDKGGRTPIKRADFVDGKKIREGDCNDFEVQLSSNSLTICPLPVWFHFLLKRALGGINCCLHVTSPLFSFTLLIIYIERG